MVDSLEFWLLWIKRLSVIAAVVIAISVGLQYWLERKLSILTAPRHLSQEQHATLVDRIQETGPKHIRFHAYAFSDESQNYAGELLEVFRETGWTADKIAFYVDEGKPPEGVAVLVSSMEEVSSVERLIFRALNDARIDGLVFSADPATLRGWPTTLGEGAIIRVGVKPKR